MCAIDRGRSVDTTMGFSPQSGLESATRHGDLDVFAVLFMMERHGWSGAEVRRQLAGEGGLAGLSGIAGGEVVRTWKRLVRMRVRLALSVFAYQVKKKDRRWLADAAAMGGLDAIAFDGGHWRKLGAAAAPVSNFWGEARSGANEDGTQTGWSQRPVLL